MDDGEVSVKIFDFDLYFGTSACYESSINEAVVGPPIVMKTAVVIHDSYQFLGNTEHREPCDTFN